MKRPFNYQFFSIFLFCCLGIFSQAQAQTTIYLPEISSTGSCNLVRSLSTTNLNGITAVQLEFWTSQPVQGLTSRLELTSSGGPDNGEYATSFTDNIDNSKLNQWQTLTIPFDLAQVFVTVGNTTPNINAINYLRMYISGEPSGTYKVRNIKAVRTTNIYAPEISSSGSCNLVRNLSPTNLSGITDVQLEFWTSQPVRGLTSRLELTSSGGPDNGEYAASFTDNIDNGKLNQWQTLTIPFDLAQVFTTVGNTTPNISAINYLRMYIVGEPNGTYKVRNIKALMGTISGTVDNTPPSQPTGLNTSQTNYDVLLTWNASTDNVGVTGYDVYNGNTRVATNRTTRNFTFTNLSAGSYTFKVAAKDAAGNVSTQATTPATLGAITRTLQAETANVLSGCGMASNHSGANGPNGEFVDYGGDGTYAEFTNVSGLPSTGSLTVRYSAENSTRGLQLKVNNTTYPAKSSLSPTTSWSQWKTATWTNVSFAANNTIRLTAVGNGPNLDELVINGVGLSNSGGNITLPIEVLGAEGTTASVQFTVNNLSSSNNKLQLVINNLSYQNKGSVKINNGSYLALNHANVDMQPQALARGGMVHGGFNTIRLTIPGNDLQNGNNTVTFRFDESDGISIGYRVVKMNVLDANGSPLLGSNVFTEDNPDNWTGPSTSAAAISRGATLWSQRNKLWNHYLPSGRTGSWYSYDIPTTRPITASCSDCHTKDGRDLELFSYSNKSIIERAKFHKLSQSEAEDITSYIRSLSAGDPNIERVGRPWNPPYQPGPALDGETNMNLWAAGAGLDAVLETDAEMLPYLFPNGVTKAEIEQLFDKDAMYDRTIIPLAIQFPDWKHWLPMVHPLDAYDNNYLLNTSPRKPLKGIDDMRAFLDNYYSSNSVNNPPSNLLSQLVKMYDEFRFFQEDGATNKNHWRTQGGRAEANLKNGIAHELANTSLARLLSVKNFEFMQEFQLQDKADRYVNAADQPGDRQWPSLRYSVFEVPPHFTARNSKAFVGQQDKTGYYESTNWYNLQFVLNGGNGLVGGTQPTDFNYHVPHIGRAIRSSGIDEPLRYFSAIAQSWQIRTWTGQTGPGEKGYKLKQQGPWAFVGIDQNFDFFYTKFTTKDRPHIMVDKLADINPNLPKWIVGALLKQFNDEMDRNLNRLSAWPRTTDTKGSSTRLERASKNDGDLYSLNTLKNKIGGMPHRHADKLNYITPILKEIMGNDCAEVNRYLDWCNDAFTQINWPGNCSSSNRTVVAPNTLITQNDVLDRSVVTIGGTDIHNTDANNTALITNENGQQTRGTAALYPNPFSQTFLLNTMDLEANQTYYLKLQTALGITVHQQEMHVNASHEAISVTPNITSGMYLLTLYDQQGNVVHSHKIIKQ